jgi:glycosyltransferase involved in cell wall biosynthesis
MHIGLNAHLLSLGENYRGAGISWYIFNLLRQLAEVETPHELSVYLGERRFKDESGMLSLRYSRWSTQNPLARIVWEQTILPWELQRTQVDLLHAMAFAGPILSHVPMVVTIYDLSFLRFPEAFRPFNRWYLSQFTKLSARRARRLIAISESTRRDVVRYFGVPEDQVDVVYCGVDPWFRPLEAEQQERFRRAYALPDKYILFLGTLEPRKNLDRLVSAYSHWCRAESGVPPLVIAGARGWYYQTVLDLVRTLGLEDMVVLLGYVPQQDLPSLYSSAQMFVYPSLFEGFGLPVLEAMAAGVPVITSNVSSLPEVAGDAGVLVDPTDVEGLAAAIGSLWRDPDRRRSLSSAGIEQASRFSWSDAAQKTMSVYERAMGR